MSRLLSAQVINLLRELIHEISGLNENTDACAKIEKRIIKQLQDADSMLFLNRKEVDADIKSLSDKFNFHGFCAEGEDLQKFYSKYMQNTLNKDELNKRLNVVRFLTCMSERPTEKLMNYKKAVILEDEVEVINWTEYLQEGIPRWSPPSDAESSDWGDSRPSSPVSKLNQSEENPSIGIAGLFDLPTETTSQAGGLDCLMDQITTAEDLRHKLKSKVQSVWFNSDHVRMVPESRWADATVAMDWEQYKDDRLYNLFSLPKSTIITEYLVIREILLEFSSPHPCMSFRYDDNGKLIVNPELTIASVRQEGFQPFIKEFIPYIELLQMFRVFHDSVTDFDAEQQPPNTYRAYDSVLQSVLHPIQMRIGEIEKRVQKQETTETLLKLLNEITILLSPAVILKKIHENVVLDWKSHSPLECAVTLLTRLHEGIFSCPEKVEHDLYLTLYLGSLYAYFAIIDKWLTQDSFTDYNEEFIIANINPKVDCALNVYSVSETEQYAPLLDARLTERGEQNWQMEFFVRSLENEAPDELMNIIKTKVLNLGKNVHLLMLMDKLHLAYNSDVFAKGSLYDEFVNTVLLKLSEWGSESSSAQTEEVVEDKGFDKESMDNLVVNWVGAKKVTEMDKLVNLVHRSNPFLIAAFRKYFQPMKEIQAVVKPSLFERVQKSSRQLLRGPDVIGKVFSDVLNKRFAVPGVLVRNLLVKENKLEKQFEFLQHIFLFKDDFTFYFYRRIFQQMDYNDAWGNSLWLTSHLQDLLMDSYPEFYQQCSVQVKENWKHHNDPLKACGMVNIRYMIEWPLNVVIRTEHLEMYKEIFSFALKIKWVLYTLNHLYFDELNPKVEQPGKAAKVLQHQLKLLRFKLLSIFSKIQHYVFGYLFHTYSEKFASDFEASSDVESLIGAHENFVKSIHVSCVELRDFKCTTHGFHLLVYLVMKLRLMWKNSKSVNGREVDKMEVSYKHSVNNINSFLVSRYLYG